MIQRWLARIRMFFRRLFGGAPMHYDYIFPIDTDPEKVQQAIRQRLATAPGEFMPDYGTNIRRLLNRPPSNTAIAASLKRSGLVRDAYFDGKVVKILLQQPAEHIVLNIGKKP